MKDGTDGTGTGAGGDAAHPEFGAEQPARAPLKSGAPPEGRAASSEMAAEAAKGGAIPPPGRSRSFTAPPPDPAEALYYEGMAAYQHRNWEEALERFSRLKELQPTRPGLDALLDEVRWFLQLEAASPAAGQTDEVAEPESKTPPQEGERLPRWQTWGAILLGAIGILAIVLIAFQGHLPPWASRAEREVQELYDRGQARLAAGDYEGAQAAFKKLLTIFPDDPEALLGLNRAERQQTLAQGYAAAEAAIAEENWDLAATELEKILVVDSSYADAQAKADFVAQRRRLAGLYSEGSRLYDLGRWGDAIVQFEKIRELDSTYRGEAVTEFLFTSYLNAGQTYIQEADGDVASVQRGVEYLSSALAVHPRNRLASDARRLGGLYLDAMRALAAGNRDEAQARLERLLAEAPTFAGGGAAEQLYSLLLQKAEATLRIGDIPAAIEYYQQAQQVAVADHSAAVQGEAYARAITPTPTPRPTSVPSPTSPPATPTPYAIARADVLNVRTGPGTRYPLLGQNRAGEPLAIQGRSPDGAWLFVCCVVGRPGWVSKELVDIRGGAEALAVVTPVAPPPSATRQPTTGRPTSVATQATCIAGQIRNASGGSPLQGWIVLLQAPDGAVQTQSTDENGAYRFSNLAPGTYTVTEQLDGDWRAISPRASTVTVAPAAACITVDFWNERSAPGQGIVPTPPR